MSSKIAIVYHSGYGHTEVVANHVAKGARDAGAEVSVIKAEEVSKSEEGPWDKLNEADAIIFGSPTYMGSASAPMKAFMEASSKVWFTHGWKDKLAAGFTNSGAINGDKLNTLIQFAILAGQHGMIWVSTAMMPGNASSTGSIEDLNRMGSYIGLMTQSNLDEGPDLAPIASDKRTAEAFGKRIAEVTERWVKTKG